MFGNNRTESVILLPKQPKGESKRMSLSLLKWILPNTILSFFSVDCRWFLGGLLPVFEAMLPVASTSWMASSMRVHNSTEGREE